MPFAWRIDCRVKVALGTLGRASVLLSTVALSACATTTYGIEGEHRSSFASVAGPKVIHNPAAGGTIFYKAVPQVAQQPIPIAFQALPFDGCRPSEATARHAYGTSLLNGKKSRDEAAAHLGGKLKLGGYNHLSHHNCSDGFVFLTALEWIELDRSPHHANRWVSSNFSLPFGLNGFFNSFWNGREGRFRTFLVSVRDKHPTEPQLPIADDLLSTIDKGTSSLDRGAARLPVGASSVTVYEYIFEVRKGQKPQFIPGSRVKASVIEDLAKAGVVLDR